MAWRVPILYPPKFTIQTKLTPDLTASLTAKVAINYSRQSYPYKAQKYAVFFIGASILRMMQHFLTESTFKKGLQAYLKRHSYQTATQNDLWVALNDQALMDGTLPKSISVQEIMNTWTLQKGYPLITVTRNYETGSVTFCQEKFHIPYNSVISTTSNTYRWHVPISYSTQVENSDFQNTSAAFWMNSSTSQFTPQTPIVPSQNFLIVNVQQTGYYRVNYDATNWKLITKQLTHSPKTIHTLNRAQLVDDAFNLAGAEYLCYEQALNLTLFLSTEKEFLPWQAFANGIAHLSHMLSRSPVYGEFQEFVRDLIDEQYSYVGFEESSPETEILRRFRGLLIGLACHVENKACVDKAREAFAAWMMRTDVDKINPLRL